MTNDNATVDEGSLGIPRHLSQPSDVGDIVERLETKRCVDTDRDSRPIYELVNPDGPEAAAVIRQLSADNAAMRHERDALLEKPISLSKMDSIDDDTGAKMVAYYWCEQAEIARDVAQDLQAKVDEAVEAGFDAAVSTIRSWLDRGLSATTNDRLKAVAADLEKGRGAILSNLKAGQ
jgi:hypothetical protein